MGAVAAMNSISRVIEAHGDAIRAEMMEHVPEPLRGTVAGVELEARNYSIGIYWRFGNGGELPGPELDIDELADRYPDCEVGY